MIIPFDLCLKNFGYIAGAADGIVTVTGQPAIRKIYLLDTQTLAWLQTAKSTKTGNYIFMGLDPNRKYIVIVRDIKPDTGEPYAPFAWDYVSPATDLALEEQQQLWQSWQS